MSLQSKTLLRPLVIPDTDCDKEMVEEKYCRFFKHYSKLKEEDYMLSPANPARWEGASSRARFGLDIGGTLCKVVYFEPFDDFGSATPLSRTVGLSMPYVSSKGQENCTTRKMPIHESEQGRIVPEISLSKGAESSIPCVFLEGQENCITGKMAINEQDLSSEQCCFLSRSNGRYVNQDSHEFEEKNHVPSLDILQDEQGINQETMKVEMSFLAHGSKPVSGVDKVFEGMVHDNEKCVSDSEYLNQVHKIWVSSHDPVILPGRGTLHFKCFETWRMEEFLFLTKEHNLVTDRRALGATGGGARKFGRQFLEIAGLQLDRADELKSLVRGIDFLMKHAQHESFEYLKAGSFQGGVIQRPLMSSEDGNKENMLEEENLISIQQVENDISTLEKKDDLLHEMDRVKIETSVLSRGRNGSFSWLGEERKLYPYIVVNIGSGVSILLVESPEQFKRVGGTSLGGSTFFGLTSILTGCSSFEEAIDLAAEGDSTEIDMLVGDIYGGDYSEMDLAATTVASSFGKLVHPTRRAAAMETPQHLAKAALLMITNNIGSLAKLHAQATGVENVLFTGSFMHGNKVHQLAMRLLSVAMEFWSKGQIKATFLRHEGHAGAMGALLNALDPSNQTDSLLLGS